MVPTVGAGGAPGAASTVNAVADEIQPSTVEVTLKFPAASPENIPVALLCGAITGFVPVTVYDIPTPLAGTVTVIIPVATMHVGCVVTDATGADGAPGTTLITTFADSAEIQPVAISVTIKL